jgi:hypothetical protein
MGTKKRVELINKIKKIGLPQDIKETPIVSLEDFFMGNDDIGSIGCNLLDHPGTESFFKLLKEIREKDNVSGIFVGIYEIEEEDETMWPFSEKVYIITSASKDDVKEWVMPLDVSEVDEVKKSSLKPSPVVEDGFRIIQLWWD